MKSSCVKLLFFVCALARMVCGQNVVVQPDCVANVTFTAAGDIQQFKNVGIYCVNWTFSYSNSGFSALSVIVETAPGSTTTPGSWSTFGTPTTGSNPNTATTSAVTIWTNQYFPWMRVRLTSKTGTGTLTGILYGYKNASARNGGGSGGGTPGGSVNDIQWKLDSTTFGGGRCSMDSSQNVTCAGSYTAGNGSGTTGSVKLTGATSAATSTITVDATNTATTVKLPNDATSGLRVVTTPSATPASGCASFNGTSTELTSTGVACGSGSRGSGGFTAYSGPAETLPAAGVTFFPPGGGGPPSTTEDDVQGISPAATISSFHVTLSEPIGMGNTVTFTWRKTGVDQTVTCTISGAVAISCSDTTHSFSVASGDLLSISATTTGTVVITPEIVMLFSTGGGGGGGSTTVHHQFFTAATLTSNGTCATAAGTQSGVINGPASTNLCASNPLGVQGPFSASVAGVLYFSLPATWTGDITVKLETMTSTNNTGNFSFTPGFLCQAAGADLVAAPSYTSGTTVTVAAPGGAGSGFYRTPVTLTVAANCSAGDAIQIVFLRGASDTYAGNIFLLGADVSMTY